MPCKLLGAVGWIISSFHWEGTGKFRSKPGIAVLRSPLTLCSRGLTRVPEIVDHDVV